MRKIERIDFANWIPKKVLLTILVFLIISLAMAFRVKHFLNSKILMTIFLFIALVILVLELYMLYCYRAFSFNGGKVMRKIHKYVLSFTPDDMEGRIIDIGCGSGAISIELAKKYTKASIIGIDYWGANWDYSLKQCIDNARIANLDIEFKRGDAAKLEFVDESFDMAISNFVFHEVKTVDNKEDLIIEALRVVKNGGFFIFHDLFESKSFYNNINMNLKRGLHHEKKHYV